MVRALTLATSAAKTASLEVESILFVRFVGEDKLTAMSILQKLKEISAGGTGLFVSIFVGDHPVAKSLWVAVVVAAAGD
jgi:hypothetical protein